MSNYIFRDLESVMPNIIVQVKADIEKIQPNPTEESSEVFSILDNQIMELPKQEHKIRELVSE